MGQYYTPVLIRTDKKTKEKTIYTFNSHDYNNGSKLMEHSYFTNSFVETVAMQLYKKPARIAWVGDYASEYINDLRQEGKKDLVEKYTPYSIIENDETIQPITPKHDYRKNCLALILYNHDKKEYIDFFDFFANNSYQDGDWSTCIHPLPLLTAIGNGYGGGDYYNGYPDADKVGIWAGDLLELAPYKHTFITEHKYKDITRTLHWAEKKVDPNDKTQ